MKLQNLYLINLLYKRRVVGSQEKRSWQESEAHPSELIDTAVPRSLRVFFSWLFFGTYSIFSLYKCIHCAQSTGKYHTFTRTAIEINLSRLCFKVFAYERK